MSAERDVLEPGELVHPPRPSLVPALFAFALALTLCGMYAEGLMVRGWVFSIIGALVALGAFRVVVKGATADYFRLPRRQLRRGAVLPVETISPPQG
jgi:hypothetical protein